MPEVNLSSLDASKLQEQEQPLPEVLLEPKLGTGPLEEPVIPQDPSNGEPVDPSSEHVSEAEKLEKLYWQYALGDLIEQLSRKDLFQFYHYQEFLGYSKRQTISQEIRYNDNIKLLSALMNADRLQQIAEMAESSTDTLFTAGNLLTALLAGLSLILPQCGALKIISEVLTIGWNHWDAGAGAVSAADSHYKKEYVTKWAILASSTVLFASTMVFTLSAFHIIAGSLGAGAAGFGFAACMFVASGLELRQAYRAESRAKEFETLLEQELEISVEERSPEQHAKINALYNGYKMEKAQVARHKENAVMWASCGIGMTAAAVFGLLAATGTISLSVASFGVAPALVAFVCVGFAVWRHYQGKRKLQVEGLKKPSEKSTITATEFQEEKSKKVSWNFFGALSSSRRATVSQKEIRNDEGFYSDSDSIVDLQPLYPC